MSLSGKKVWKDDETLWKDTVSKSPNKSRVHSGLAYHYYETARYDEAIVEARKAIDLDKSWLVPYVNLGLSYAHKKNSNDAIYWLSEVIKLYEDVNAFKKLLPPLYKELDLVPVLPSRIAVEAYNGIGTVYMDLGKYKEAMKHMDLLNKKITEAEDVLGKIDEVREKEHQKVEEWKRDLAYVKEKLLAIDKELFGD